MRIFPHRLAQEEDEDLLKDVMMEMFPADYYYSIFSGVMNDDRVYEGIRNKLHELGIRAEYANYNDWRVYRVDVNLLSLLPKIGVGNGDLLPFSSGGGQRLYPLEYFGDRLKGISQLKWVTVS